jgi:uncharacterized protein DUF4145
MNCPHCQVAFHGDPITTGLRKDSDGVWCAVTYLCPSCNRISVDLVCATQVTGSGQGLHFNGMRKKVLGYPRASSRPSPPPEVPPEFGQDYVEAALVLADSPKASAALSRRCLQHILREKAGVKKADLAKEIDEVLQKALLPTHLAEAIDAVRNIGNFAAHPIKGTASGEVLPVEPGEAEWNLDVLDGLFDFFFVQPAILKKRRAALNSKLCDAGKPNVK